MKIKDKIVQTLASMTAELLEIGPDFYIIGASAMILSDIEIEGEMKFHVQGFKHTGI